MGMFFSDNEDNIARRKTENDDKSMFFHSDEEDDDEGIFCCFTACILRHISSIKIKIKAQLCSAQHGQAPLCTIPYFSVFKTLPLGRVSGMPAANLPYAATVCTDAYPIRAANSNALMVQL